MKPEIFVMATYWLFGIWMYTISAKGKKGIFKKENAHILTVFPTKDSQKKPYTKAYVDFHNRVMILALIMGVFCFMIGRLLPIIFSSLAFFTYLNFYKYQAEEKIKVICGGGKLA